MIVWITEQADKTIAISPKASGASSRVSTIFLPKRATCSEKLPAPNHAPPRNTLAFRLSPRKNDSTGFLIRSDRVGTLFCRTLSVTTLMFGSFIEQLPWDSGAGHSSG